MFERAFGLPHVGVFVQFPLPFVRLNQIVHSFEALLERLLVLATLVALIIQQYLRKPVLDKLADLHAAVAVEYREQGISILEVDVANGGVLHLPAPALHLALGELQPAGLLGVKLLLCVGCCQVCAHFYNL